jgi:hypothetical protein
MFRALLSKEWTQLRTLRWVGFGLGILQPPFLIATASAAQRGWLPYGSVGGFSSADLMLSAMPMLLVGLWGLLALLMTAQSFAGDRSAGTEQFLLERPVPRSKVWGARLLASLASALVVYVGHVTYWALLSSAVADPTGGQWRTALFALAVIGPAILGVAFVAGIAAATLLPVPMPAVLLGLVLAFGPAVLASMLGGLFPLAAMWGVPLGLVLPWLLLVAYLLASYRMHCRGEPAGRGRLRRGLSVLVASLIVVPLLFLVLAPIAIRAGSTRLGWVDLAIPRGGDVRTVSLINRTWPTNAGWLLDVEQGKRLRFLPPPTYETAWSDNGDRVAVAHAAGLLGQITSRIKIDFFAADGSRAGESLELGESVTWVKELRWHGEKLLAVVAENLTQPTSSIVIMDPRDGGARTVALPVHVTHCELVGPDDTGEIYVFKRAEAGPPPRFVLRRLDVANARLDAEPLLEEREEFPAYVGKWISPSGRYWLRHTSLKLGTGVRIADLDTDQVTEHPECWRAAWLAGDRYACLEVEQETVRVTAGRPGEPRAEIISRQHARIVFEVSPDGRRILVLIWDAPAELAGEQFGHLVWNRHRYWRTGSELLEALVLEPESAERIDLGRRIDLKDQPRDFNLRWVGSESLIAFGRGRVALLAVEGDEPPRHILGSR